jgi:hypothetical protein
VRRDRDLGDFQTPKELVAAVLRAVSPGPIGARWTRVLEPTCGSGSFLRGLLDEAVPPAELIGIEIQAAHAEAARSTHADGRTTRVQIIRSSIFEMDLDTDLRWNSRGPLLVVGNPPWITCAELGRLGSDNRPARRNVKALRGIDALTGSSNFDIAEAIWLKLIEDLAPQRPTIALLCKSAVARSVLELAFRHDLPVAEATIHEIDAPRWFGAAVGACLFRMTLGREPTRLEVPVFASLDATRPSSVMGFFEGRLVGDVAVLRRHRYAIGVSPLTWRQGLKHDAAAIMELSADEPAGPLKNRLGEVVDVEPEFVYPLLKGSDLRKPSGMRPRRAVIVTQRKIGEETLGLENEAPRLWRYLQSHAARFSGRKSSIYRRQPPFALFGVGPYSFAHYKVAVSGLHRPPLFRAIGPVDRRPVMLDDTCYLLPCRMAGEAAVLAAMFNHPTTLEVLRALSFGDAKRAVTKGQLQRLDLPAILDRADRGELSARAEAVLVEDLGLVPEDRAPMSDEIERLRYLLGDPGPAGRRDRDDEPDVPPRRR